MKSATVFLIVFFVTVGAFCRPKRVEEGLAEPTKCELVNEPKRFANAKVRVSAIVMSDLIEHTMLVASACPEKGISLWIPHELDDLEGVRELRAALKSQWAPGHMAEAQVTAVFTGIFLYERKQRFLKVSQGEKVGVEPSTH